ncbi:MAG: 1-acyl-sn-glycerol-3-phosphate acyltransferase [Verrucomicrobia bacterium]|nr:1-acyl-sn-glycerol-3-phosphate acyltransferase [Verrucomicrobiota bacterium]MCH8514447.1 1-acyl-sn-glycerol-3-phosphate acyltransferase [Kiritimatiellia bacterium]
MMGRIRLVLRVIASVLFCLVMWLYALWVKFITRNDMRRRYRLTCRGMSFWGHVTARIFGMSIRVHGTPPEAPFFLVTNHISYTDILLLCATCPAWFISKAEVAKWPGIGALTRSGNTLFLDRETRRDVHRMNKIIADLVREGGGVGFYPEGTTTDGTTILPFKPSLLQPAIELGIPVNVGAIAYETPPGTPPPSKWVAWIGDDEFSPHAKRLLSAPGFTAHVSFGEQTVRADDRKELAKRAHSAVSQLYDELLQEIANAKT